MNHDHLLNIEPRLYGYLLLDMPQGPRCYSVRRPPSGGAVVVLPENVSGCFERQETADVGEHPHTLGRNCSLHCVFTDDEGTIVDKSYRFA